MDEDRVGSQTQGQRGWLPPGDIFVAPYPKIISAMYPVCVIQSFTFVINNNIRKPPKSSIPRFCSEKFKNWIFVSEFL